MEKETAERTLVRGFQKTRQQSFYQRGSRNIEAINKGGPGELGVMKVRL